MKYILIIALLMLAGCKDTDIATTDWINQARKPILTYTAGNDLTSQRIITFISADGKAFVSGRTFMVVPDTIKCIPTKEGTVSRGSLIAGY